MAEPAPAAESRPTLPAPAAEATPTATSPDAAPDAALGGEPTPSERAPRSDADAGTVAARTDSDGAPDGGRDDQPSRREHAAPADGRPSQRPDTTADGASGTPSTPIAEDVSLQADAPVDALEDGLPARDEEAAAPSPDAELAEPLPEAERIAAPAARTPDAPTGPGLRGPARTLPAGTWSALLVQHIDPIVEAADEWATLALDLGEGDGNMTVRARHDDGRLVVAVHLSDPTVRAAAQGQAQEIRQQLEQHYGTSVDLSFESGSGGDQPSDNNAPPAPARAPRTGAPRPTSSPTRPALSRQEWIG